MESSFSRVKSVIDRLREVLKCQKCSQMKEENSMLFYHICDHFYCADCVGDQSSCPLCKNPLDKPTNVVSDKNILSLYNSLAKFELPSKQDIENIYKIHKQSKEEELKENSNTNREEVIRVTPKKQTKGRLNLRNTKKTNLASPEETATITLSSGGGESSAILPKGTSIICEESVPTSGRGKKISTPARRGRSFTAITSTPIRRGRNTSVTTPAGGQGGLALLNSSGSSKGNTSLNKSNINKRNPKGETQLHLACKKLNFTAMAELINAGADPNAQDNAGWTPLHDSVFSGNIEVVKFLLDNRAKVNAPGLENTTALHEAIAKGNVKIVKLLLDYGADVNAMNIFKETPLDLVRKYKLEEMEEVLSEASNNTKKTSVEVEETEPKLLYKYSLSMEDEKLVNKFADKFGSEIIPSLMSKAPPTHIIIPHEKVQMTWALVSSVPKGCWVVTSDWIKDSLRENAPKPARSYIPSSPSFSGFSRARSMKLNQLPGLFSGCHFFFGGAFEQYTIKNLTIGKEDLKTFVEKNGGAIVKRCPDPESLALEKTIPFHATSTSSLRDTSYFIIYQTEKWDPKPKYNMSHMKTLPVEWLIYCVLKFELIDPNDKEISWSEFF